MLRWLALAAIAAALSACGTVPPINFSVANVGPSQTKLDAEIKSITVTIANREEATGDLNPQTSLVTHDWETAVKEAFDRMAVFRDDAPRKLSVAVKILRLELTNGPTVKVDTTARYQLIDRATGAVVFGMDVSTRGEGSLDYSIVAVARSREALNRSVQANIQQFLQALGTVNLGKA
jgi:hypothetical protein